MRFQNKLKWIQGLNLALIMPVLISAASFPVLAAGAGKNPECVGAAESVSETAKTAENQVPKKAPAKKESSNDLAQYRAGKPAINGGVTTGKIRDQKCGEICWSEALNRFVDNMTFKTNWGNKRLPRPTTTATGIFIFKSPNHPTYFDKLAARVKAGHISLEQAAIEGVRMLHSGPHSMAAGAKEFVVDSGSDEPTALKEAKITGFVPDRQFDAPISTEAQAKELTKALKSLVEAIITSPTRSTYFGAKDADTINTPLYNLMNEKLKDVIKNSAGNNHLPYRPGDTFVGEDGKTYTPVTYMTDYLKFNPDDFVEVAMTPENADKLLAAVHEQVTVNKIPVPVGFDVYNPETAEKDTLWSVEIFNEEQPQEAGGHEVLIGNIRLDGPTGTPMGHVADDSWGQQGEDADGNIPQDMSKSGRNGITYDYHRFTLAQKEPSTFVFTRSFLKEKYPSLLDDAVAQAAAGRPRPVHRQGPKPGHVIRF